MFFFLMVINAFLAVVLIITLINAISAPFIKNGPNPKDYPLVSVLIPVRNEEYNIPLCLESLLHQDYPFFEIIVLNDGSTDASKINIQDMMNKDSRISLYDGEHLPDGWTGKNWACYQLSAYAKGDILLFTDADNRYEPHAITRTIGWMQHLNLDMISAFPQQITKTLAEKLVVSSVYMTVYCYLPMWLTYYTPFPSIAAANGQWIVFTKKAYNRLGGHKSVKHHIVEDTELARLAKKKKMKILTTSGKGVVYGRMYRNWSELWNGFSKNLFGLMGFKTVPFVMLLCFMFICYILPYVLVWIPSIAVYAAIALILNVLIRTLASITFKDPFISILLHPVAIFLTLLIGINSFHVFRTGTLKWKGREIFQHSQN